MDYEAKYGFTPESDYETMCHKITIPEGFEAHIEGNKVIMKRKEGEDERIRKEIIDFLKVNGGIVIPKEWISWLEKQKEQKVLPGIGNEKWIPGRDFIPVAWVDACDKYGKWMIMSTQVKMEFDEKEKEAISKLRHILNEYALRHSGIDVNGDYCEQEFIDIDTFLKALPERINFEKVQRWSEEDEDNMHRVIRVLEDNDSDWKELTDWLKSLRPQPHWKPSEEQMKALKLVFYNRPIGTHELTVLESLYHDLKKLMED